MTLHKHIPPIQLGKIDIKDEKDRSGKNLYRELFLQESTYMLKGPDDTGFVEHKTTDEKEQRHADLCKIRMIIGDIIDMQAECGQMLTNHQYHGEPA